MLSCPFARGMVSREGQEYKEHSDALTHRKKGLVARRIGQSLEDEK